MRQWNKWWPTSGSLIKGKLAMIPADSGGKRLYRHNNKTSGQRWAEKRTSFSTGGTSVRMGDFPTLNGTMSWDPVWRPGCHPRAPRLPGQDLCGGNTVGLDCEPGTSLASSYTDIACSLLLGLCVYISAPWIGPTPMHECLLVLRQKSQISMKNYN